MRVRQGGGQAQRSSGVKNMPIEQDACAGFWNVARHPRGPRPAGGRVREFMIAVGFGGLKMPMAQRR